MSGFGPYPVPNPKGPRGPLAGIAATTTSTHARGGGIVAAKRSTREPRMPVPVRGSRKLDRPFWLVVGKDVSGSTASSDPNGQSDEALLELCDWMRLHSGDPRDRIGLVRFADRADTVPAIPVGKAREALALELLSGADVGGGTRLTPAVEALCAALPRRGARRLAVLITDGQVTETDEQLRGLFARLRAQADAVHLVALNHDGYWSGSTHFRYEQLGLSGTTVIGTLSQAQLAHALASLLMAETGMVERRGWRRR